jgi:hypothetical protein
LDLRLTLYLLLSLRISLLKWPRAALSLLLLSITTLPGRLFPLKALLRADRALIALGIKLQIPIYTADKIWNELQLNNADIKLIR